MRIALTEKLLVKVMNWTSEEISNEIPLLQALANFKFDEYQQFSAGIRFIESLALWLNQFDKIEERRIVYDFIKTHLIFISNNQISQLVNLSFSILIRPILIEKVAIDLKLSKYHVRKIVTTDEYKNTLRQSLFIGLSDGSRIDQLRRYAKLSNEQVLTSYFIDEEKKSDLLAELNSDSNLNNKFTTIFLIDDFTASGTSYARILDKKNEKGKIIKFLKKIYTNSENSGLRSLFDIEKLSIHIIFYIATNDAILYIDNEIKNYLSQNNLVLNYTIQCIQNINETVKSSVLLNESFVEIIKNEKYFDNSIADKHYLMAAKKENLYLGFNECGLPLVLNHNTPNNSLPIIWFSDDKLVRGLFPRITRHKE